MDSEPGSISDSHENMRSIITASSSENFVGPSAISDLHKENERFPNRDAAAGRSRTIEGISKHSEENRTHERSRSTGAHESGAHTAQKGNGSLDKRIFETFNPLAGSFDFPPKNPGILNQTSHEAPEYVGYYFGGSTWQTSSTVTPLDTFLERSCAIAPDETECIDYQQPGGQAVVNPESTRQSRTRSSILVVDPGSAQIDGAQSWKPSKRPSQGESHWSESSESTPPRSRRQTLRDSIGAIIRGRPSLPEIWRRISPDRSAAPVSKAEPKHEPRNDPRWPNDEEDGKFCDALMGLMRRREQARMDEQKNLMLMNRHSV